MLALVMPVGGSVGPMGGLEYFGLSNYGVAAGNTLFLEVSKPHRTARHVCVKFKAVCVCVCVSP